MEVSWIPNAVPEPGSLLLLAIGLAAFGLGGHRRVDVRQKSAAQVNH
jgi:hypothetical protein